jgi:hypothetical protein
MSKWGERKSLQRRCADLAMGMTNLNVRRQVHLKKLRLFFCNPLSPIPIPSPCPSITDARESISVVILLNLVRKRRGKRKNGKISNGRH